MSLLLLSDDAGLKQMLGEKLAVVGSKRWEMWLRRFGSWGLGFRFRV